MAKIKVENVSKVFGPSAKKVLSNLEKNFDKQDVLAETDHAIGVYKANFEVEEGEVFVIIGLSGSGKSTLIRCLNMLNKPTSGKIIIDGEDIVKYDSKKLREVRRHKVAMVFQNFALLSHKNVLENVMFGLKIRGINKEESREKAKTMLSMVGLEGYEDSPISSLSGGMKQRVGLARALANDPEILLMDEAFSALDPIVRRDMQFELIKLQKKLKKTIVFITHDINEAFKLGDHVAIMKDARIVQIGTPEEILSNPCDDYVERFTVDIDKTRVLPVRMIMSLPGCLTKLKDGPKVALQEMKASSVSSAYVIDDQLQLKGIVTLNATVEAIKNKTPLSDIMNTDFIEVDQDTLISDMVPLATQTPFPIAVKDENGKLCGIVTKVAILSHL